MSVSEDCLVHTLHGAVNDRFDLCVENLAGCGLWREEVVESVEVLGARIQKRAIVDLLPYVGLGFALAQRLYAQRDVDLTLHLDN